MTKYYLGKREFLVFPNCGVEITDISALMFWRNFSWKQLQCENKVNVLFLFVGEPNNDSPLNTQAANLWANQTAYKKHLHEKYEQEAKKASNSLWKMYKFRPLKFPYFSNQPTPYNEHFFLLVFQILRKRIRISCIGIFCISKPKFISTTII